MPRKTEKINRKILAIALPAIASNITTPLLGLADTAITGHIGSAVYIGAIAVGGSMFSMLYWVLNFLRMGSGGLTAQAYGRADRVEADTVLWRGLMLAALLGVLLIATAPWTGPFAAAFIDADTAATPLAVRYFSIVVWGAPAVLGTYVFTGWFLGMQNTRATMWMALTTNVVNLPISIGLVYGLGWKIEGVAVGTLVAQWSGFALGLLILRRYRPQRIGLRTLWRGSGLRRYFAINTDIMLRTACLVVVTVWFTREGASAGVVTLAANALLMQFFIFFSYFMDGFAYAGEALCGRFHGASDTASLRATIHALLRWGLALALVSAAVYLAGGRLLLTLLTDRREVVDTALVYMPWVAAVPLAGVWAFIWDGILIGLTRTRAMLVAMASAMVVFFLALSLSHPLANHGLWLAFCLYLLTRGLAEAFLYYRKHG